MINVTEFDYIVVGGGTAGCVVAARLAEAGNEVCLLEVGADGQSPDIEDSRIPNLFRLWRDANHVRLYPEQRRAPDPRLPSTMRGVTLGGCGAVNVMIHVRGNRRDYDNWKDLGNPGWGFNDVLPMLVASETYEGNGANRGKAGPIQVHHCGRSIYAAAFEAAAVDYGFHGPDADLNGATQEDRVGTYQFAADAAVRRSSTASAYLPLAPADKLTVATGLRVTRVRIDETSTTPCASGVDVLDPNTNLEIPLAARKEVVVCGGAYESPKLLMLSGIGPVDQLKEFGIESLVDQGVPGVGRNLQDHVITSVLFQSLEPLPSLDFLTEIGMFAQIEPGDSLEWVKNGWPTVQFYMNAGIRERAWTGMTPQFFGVYPSICRPKSRGTVTLLSTDPRHDPIIDPCLLSHPDDVSVLANGIRMALEIAERIPSKRVNLGPAEIEGPFAPPHIKANSPQEMLVDYAMRFSRGLWHPAGTCKMGPQSDPDAVVDASLRVRGVSCLRIADASVMPTLTCGNPNATVIMIAEKASQMILADYP